MKLKDFLKEFEGLDPELEVYRPDRDLNSEDVNSCWIAEPFENKWSIVYVRNNSRDFKIFSEDESTTFNKKVLLIF